MQKKRGIWKFIFVIIFIIIIISLFFLFKRKDDIPRSYKECKKYSDWYNELECHFDGSGKLYNKCIENGGTMAYDIDYCSITYLNPDFEFPKNYEECIEKLEVNKVSKREFCSITIQQNSTHDKEIANNLFEKCKGLGGVHS